MLVAFRFSNVRSFRDEQVFSMVANGRDHTRPEHTISSPALKERLLSTAVVYGANASGKSNLLKALGFVQRFLTDPLDPTNSRIIPESFRLDADAQYRPSVFEVTFIHKDIRYEYHLAIDDIGVHREELFAYPKGKPQRWYSRQRTDQGGESKYDFGPSLRGQIAALEKLTRPNLAFLTVAASYNHQQLSLVHEWFARHLQLWLGVADNVTLGTPRQVSEYIVANSPQLQSPMSQLLRLADLGITGLSIREEGPLPIPETTGQSMQQSFPQQVRRYLELEHQGSNGAQRFNISDESHGTQQLLVLGTFLLLGLRVGSVLVVDELDTSMHPQLVRALVELFYRDNPHNAQLIFSTHDATLLSGELFRRDQVWFVEKDRQGASHLYPLLDFSPRKDESLERGYLRGRYGAVPFIEREDWHGLVNNAAS